MFEIVDSAPQNAVIKVIGVGGGGGNAVQHMVSNDVKGVDFIAVNTDAQALDGLGAERTLQIGSSITSQHVADDEAAAADFEIPGVDNRELARWIRDNLEVDQGILEFYKDGEPTSGWIHCSYSRNKNRQQWLRAQRVDGKVSYTPWLE